MQRKNSKVLAFALITSLLCTSVINTGLTYAVESDKESVEDYTADESYIAIDEDGNVTLIPTEEIETPDAQELAEIDNIQYEIIVQVEGEESVVNVVDTEAEADQEVEVIQGIIDEQPTVEAAVEEIVEIIESDEVSQQLLETIGIEDGEEGVAEPLELNLEDSSEDGEVTEQSKEIEIARTSFSVIVESASTQSAASEKAITVTAQAVTQSVECGVVVFSYPGDVITFQDVNGGVYGEDGNYLSPDSAPDAAYLGTTAEGDIMFMQSGVVGIVDVSDYPSGTVSVIDYDTYVSQGKVTSYYYTSQGKLYHALTTNTTSIASSIVCGYQQSYMSDSTTYYSYDGHYFYTSYKAMITDYKNNTYANAINATNPYYNYYLYLSHRTTTEFTAEQIDEYLKTKITSTSKMWETGSYFIEYQNTYGANAVLMMGVAINESNWGNSNIAQTKNNLFGHGASDDNPYYNSTGYTTATDSIKYHAEKYVSTKFLDITTDYRYYGSNLGNKQSGMNVKYASDPYWGEKAAAQVWLMEMYFSSSTVDAFTETIGIVNGSASIYENPSGSVLYYLKNKDASTSWEMPVVILEETTVNGVLWYKIQSDIPLTDDRTGVSCYLQYEYANDYVYIKASDVYVVYGEVTEYEYVLGDATGDGSVTSADYIAIKNHLMGTKTISSAYLDAADANKDGKISSADYIAIKNHLMGTALLW